MPYLLLLGKLIFQELIVLNKLSKLVALAPEPITKAGNKVKPLHHLIIEFLKI